MAKSTTASRAPRGTKVLAQAFFAAADEIPEARRGEVVKAALAAIRDELKGEREKIAATKAKAKEVTGKIREARPSGKAVGRSGVADRVARTAASMPSRTRKVAAKHKMKSAAVRNKVVGRVPSAVVQSAA